MWRPCGRAGVEQLAERSHKRSMKRDRFPKFPKVEPSWKPGGNFDYAGDMDGDADNQAGERFKRWRARNGASQRRLGDLLGISHTSVGKIEGGKQSPKADIIARFEVLEREEETPESSDLPLVLPVSDDALEDGAAEGVARVDDAMHTPVHADVAAHSVASEDGVSAPPAHAMHRSAGKENTWVNPPANEVNALEVEARILREQLARLEAERERDRAQLAELIATLRAPVHADAALHSVAPERATRAEDTLPGPSGGETPDPADWTAADLKQLMEETRNAVRVGRVILGRIEETLTARPGVLIRALVALPVAWCVASGVFVVGILATYGPVQFLQLGHTVFTALRNTYWPF